MKWDEHISYTVSRAAKTLFILTTLKNMGLEHRSLWSIYFSITRSILTYAFPAICNLPARLFKKLQKIEQRAKKIITDDPPVTLSQFCDSLCSRLAKRIQKNEAHPLHSIFEKRQALGRSKHLFSKPFAKTTRYKNSFIKYA
jgi:hypothetical protein